MDEELAPLLASLPDPDREAAEAVRARAGEVLRPAGALARLDEVAAWLAGWQRTPRPAVERPAAVVFVADHGVAAEGVSAYPASVTAEMLRALRAGVATACVMARTLGARLEVVDVGVGKPSGNIAREPALTQARFGYCLEAGRRAVAALAGADLLVLGEMGIGNTTPAAAVAAALFGGSAEEWTGRGTGIDDAAYARKVAAVEAARRRADGLRPLEVLRQVGGPELVAIAGAALEARLRSVPVVLDGFVVTAACAALEVARPGALDHCLAGHCSGEPGHRLLLEKLGKPPLLDLGLRLGEGSGALAAVPLVRLAAASVTDVATFAEWGLER
ncbi:MAG TPA: nicotinate-nucleotide--dimethylbenzimidazole phosphoribosyltransferase [Actinomycetota bacterium]|nr:nicotinate-nucleotide--dimethylbenzimidazole phosphoribosyltransferase [Actinomycetota bacterium]